MKEAVSCTWECEHLSTKPTASLSTAKHVHLHHDTSSLLCGSHEPSCNPQPCRRSSKGQGQSTHAPCQICHQIAGSGGRIRQPPQHTHGHMQTIRYKAAGSRLSYTPTAGSYTINTNLPCRGYVGRSRTPAFTLHVRHTSHGSYHHLASPAAAAHTTASLLELNATTSHQTHTHTMLLLSSVVTAHTHTHRQRRHMQHASCWYNTVTPSSHSQSKPSSLNTSCTGWLIEAPSPSLTPPPPPTVLPRCSTAPQQRSDCSSKEMKQARM